MRKFHKAFEEEVRSRDVSRQNQSVGDSNPPPRSTTKSSPSPSETLRERFSSVLKP